MVALACPGCRANFAVRAGGAAVGHAFVWVRARFVTRVAGANFGPDAAAVVAAAFANRVARVRRTRGVDVTLVADADVRAVAVTVRAWGRAGRDASAIYLAVTGTAEVDDFAVGLELKRNFVEGKPY